MSKASTGTLDPPVLGPCMLLSAAEKSSNHQPSIRIPQSLWGIGKGVDRQQYESNIHQALNLWSISDNRAPIHLGCVCYMNLTKHSEACEAKSAGSILAWCQPGCIAYGYTAWNCLLPGHAGCLIHYILLIPGIILPGSTQQTSHARAPSCFMRCMCCTNLGCERCTNFSHGS